ncbi:MAG: hypothetical protein ACTSUQ_10630 [Candidatus Freyarchaeota archaeon]
MEREYEAFWVFEEETVGKSKKHKNEGLVVSERAPPSYKYEGSVALDDRGISLQGKRIETGEMFEAYIPFSDILEMRRVYPHAPMGERALDNALKIVYRISGKSVVLYLQEKPMEFDEEDFYI